jgi:hypothetical protein
VRKLPPLVGEPQKSFIKIVKFFHVILKKPASAPNARLMLEVNDRANPASGRRARLKRQAYWIHTIMIRFSQVLHPARLIRIMLQFLRVLPFCYSNSGPDTLG